MQMINQFININMPDMEEQVENILNLMNMDLRMIILRIHHWAGLLVVAAAGVLQDKALLQAAVDAVVIMEVEPMA